MNTTSLLRPRVILPLVVIIVLFSVLMSPVESMSSGAPSLSTHSTAPTGASGFAAVVEKLGWRTEKLESRLSDSLPTDAVYAVLVDSRQLTEAETHILLNRVRAGAGLVIIANGGAFRDSVHLDANDRSGMLKRGGDSTGCAPQPRSLRRLATSLPLVLGSIGGTAPLTGDTTHFLPLSTSMRKGTSELPGAIGIVLGAGRIVALGDDKALANDIFRVCKWGAAVPIMRAIEWVSQGEGTRPSTIIFDEFHHGYGVHANIWRAIWHWLSDTSPGRLALQLILASLILLMALAPRPIAPLATNVVMRRSPLEHVSALAHAYEKAHASRTAVQLLLRGVRRRAARVIAPRNTSDEQFLAAAVARYPALQDAVSRVQNATAKQVSPHDLLDAVTAIEQIDRSVRP